MTITNPYSTPNEGGEVARDVESTSPWTLRSVRVLIYFHLTAVVLCALFSLIDSGQLTLPETLKTSLPSFPFQIPLLLTPVLCPLLLAIVVWKIPNGSRLFRWSIVGGDVLLSAFQLWALLPTVQ